MTLAGWILMTVSVTSILVFTAYCFYRVLRAPVIPTRTPEASGGRVQVP